MASWLLAAIPFPVSAVERVRLARGAKGESIDKEQEGFAIVSD
jgi:hypothetical protein